MNHKPIIYTEDEEIDVFFLQRAFKHAAIPNPLVIVPDGQGLIDYIEARVGTPEQLPCLILLDLNLPVRSGLEALNWIREHPVAKSVPVVILTSSAQEIDVHSAYTHGANGYLVKPGKPIHAGFATLP